MTRRNSPQKRLLNVVWRPVEDLRVDQTHPRIHSKQQVDRIANSLEVFDFNNPILTDVNDVVIAGVGRLHAAAQAGYAEVPTIKLEHLTAEQAKAYAIADNRLGELSKFDDKLLAERMKELCLADIDFPLDVIGFDMGEIDFRIESLELQAEGDDSADKLDLASGPAVTVLGDVWQIGPHRLICGSSLDISVLDKLMHNERAGMLFTDPPYNVPIDGHVSGKGSIKHREFAMGIGEFNSLEFTNFLAQSCRGFARYSVDGSIHFVCMDWAHSSEILEAGRNVYSELKNICVWAKHNAGMGSLYRSQHEFIFVFKSGRAAHKNNVQLGKHGRNRSNVWSYPGANNFGRPTEEGPLQKLHPTVKPVRLVADCILDCSSRGDIVLDGFAGSGTTIISAERTGRRCYGVEIDPLYVDLAVRRWQQYSGDIARHAETSEPFDSRNKGSEHAS
jgi:DNA modification methylase